MSANLQQQQLNNSAEPSTTIHQLSEHSFIEKSEWLNTFEAAAYLRLSPATLRNMTSNGRVPYHKLGRSNRYFMADLRGLLFKERRGPNGI